MNKEDYKELSITELTTLLRKASTTAEQKFFVTLLNEARSKAVKKIIQ